MKRGGGGEIYNYEGVEKGIEIERSGEREQSERPESRVNEKKKIQRKV